MRIYKINLFLRILATVVFVMVFVMTDDAIAALLNYPNDILVLIGVVLEVTILSLVLWLLWMVWRTSIQGLERLVRAWKQPKKDEDESDDHTSS